MPSTPTPSTVDGRRLRLANVFNFRDLGGHRTRSGGVVRDGVVFRADGLNRLGEADVEALRPLNLRTVVDLRTTTERDDHGIAPEALGVDVVHLPVIAELWPHDGAHDAAPVDYLIERYLEMTEDVGAVAIASVLKLLARAEPEAVPLVFHCSAGKDRTGVTAAVILSVLDVDEATIAEDYHVTAGAMTDLVEWLHTNVPESIDAMADQPDVFLACPPEAMAGFLSTMVERHGSIVDYVRSIGVDAAEIDSLRSRLVL